jgi:hypothetical protein
MRNIHWLRSAGLSLIVLTGLVLGDAQRAAAQRAYAAPQRRTGATGQTTSRPAATFGTGLFSDARQAPKPYTEVQRTPTVSPYLNLDRGDNTGSDIANYQTLVRPQLEQQAFNRQQQHEMQQLNRRFRQFQAELPTATAGSDDIRSTGHQVRFLNYLHFFGQ